MTYKKKFETYTSPVGAAVWPKLNEPKRFKDPKTGVEGDPYYEVTLAMDAGEAVTFVQKVDEFMEESFRDAERKADSPKKRRDLQRAKPPYEEELDDEGNETGRVLFKFKAKAGGVTQKGKAWSRTIPLFDRYGKPLSADEIIRGGSIIQVAYSVQNHCVNSRPGIRLNIEAVLVKELATSNRSANEFGFALEAAEADGFAELGDEETGLSVSGGVDEEADF